MGTGNIHLFFLSAVQSASKEAASLDGHWGQLQVSLDNVTYSVDVGDVCLLVDHRDFSVPGKVIKSKERNGNFSI